MKDLPFVFLRIYFVCFLFYLNFKQKFEAKKKDTSTS